MTDSPTTTAPAGPQVYAAIAAVTHDMAQAGIGKGRKNQQQGFTFRGVDDVYNALAPVLARHRLCFLPRVMTREVTERATKSGGTLFYTVLLMEFDLVAEDGSCHTISTIGEAMDSADKSTNKAMSAAYKYAAFMAFCIPVEGTPDADADSPEETTPRRKETAEERAARQAGHHPSWRGAQAAFFARLADVAPELTYDELKSWCAAHQRPAPSAMDDATRAKLLAYLATDAGRASFTRTTAPAAE